MGPTPVPDFRELAAVLEKSRPSRPVMFEFILDEARIRNLCGAEYVLDDLASFLSTRMIAYARAGYDAASIHASAFRFERGDAKRSHTTSLNDGAVIVDRESLDAYPWPEPEDYPLDPLRKAIETAPPGLGIMVCGPCGVLENVIALVGYDQLCMSLHDDPLFVSDLFEHVGTRLLRYYKACLAIRQVGVLMCNDDWGFNTQTMLSPGLLRKYVFPWYARIVEEAHASGRYAVLHSCGSTTEIADDIIEGIRFDGKHSFEDGIQPVEAAYEAWKGRIAVLGGIDMGFLATETPEAVRSRCHAMLERSFMTGGYALGSGNSITDYIPEENYRAMTGVALGARRNG